MGVWTQIHKYEKKTPLIKENLFIQISYRAQNDDNCKWKLLLFLLD